MDHVFKPHAPIGRQSELETIRQTFIADGDLMLAGVTGSGRRTLIRHTAQQIGARVLELDCLRATTSGRFLTLLIENLLDLLATPSDIDLIEQWSQTYHLRVERNSRQTQLKWDAETQTDWSVFCALLTLPQAIAEQFDSRIVFVFQNFPHIRSWDRSGEWEAYLRQEIRRQSRVNYVVIATIPEPWAQESHLQVITLPPLSRPLLQAWVTEAVANKGLQFDAEALALFLDSVQGHMGDASALARRIWLDCRDNTMSPGRSPIGLEQVHRSTQTLIEDLATTFECLLLLLPPIQARVLESLAIDPTDSPHARDYIQKHQLSKGGGLQGALASLEQKGLIYSPKYGYAIALPLFRLWLKQRLG
ncbi:MAG: hypothetical protein WCD18_12725 [Thermosynechococcaceae cyanobacterium]